MSRFEKKLEKQIRTREREIERMCGFHYTNFVEAINELSGIEGDATKLVRKVASTNHDLQELGGKILGKRTTHGLLERVFDSWYQLETNLELFSSSSSNLEQSEVFFPTNSQKRSGGTNRTVRYHS